MATLDDNWQTKRSTISERTKFIFNNELLSDVKFVVPVSQNESESRKRQKCIPAHKFILAISSPVFYAMFYGEMAETSGTIQLPDCDYESLFEFFRFLYSDDVNLSGRNVMQVLYLAKKYLVPSLADKCTEYLQKHLEASNVFSVLPQAQKFGDKDLEERCWEVIETQTENALMSEEFVTLERSLVTSVVKRERLNIQEVDLFKAVDRWATKEVETQGLTPDGVVKRGILGEEIVKAIRFPVMSQKEFASVLDCDILTKEEIVLMMKHYSGFGLESSLPFMNSIRAGLYLLHRVYRFEKPGGTSDNPWNYCGKADAINLTVSKPVMLHGVQHFGSEGGKYKVSLEVRTKDGEIGGSLVRQTGKYSSEKDETNGYYGFDVIFDDPVSLEKGKRYEISSFIEGPSSWRVTTGKKSVQVQEIQFLFSYSHSSRNGTNESAGQFPAFIFSTK